MAKAGFRFNVRASDTPARQPEPRRPAFAGIGRLRKVAMLGGAKSLQFAPWHDASFELWSHASCRHLCKRDPDLLFDLHPPELWRHASKKTWDPKFMSWISRNTIPIMMQDRYPDVPASLRYPIETILTEFPRRYMTNHLAYMIALALTEGVTHIAVFGADYAANTEYGAQRGCAEYWLGVAEGRGVQVLLPKGCDLLGKPSLLYGYASHPNGVRDKSYVFTIGPLSLGGKGTPTADPGILTPSDHPLAPPLRNIGVPPTPTAFDEYCAEQRLDTERLAREGQVVAAGVL